MNKFSKIISSGLLACGLCFPFGLHATDFSRLNFTMIDNSVISVDSEMLEMVYSDGVLLLLSPKINKSLKVEEIKSMQFSSALSAVESVKPVQPEKLKFYTPDGVEAGTFNSIEEARASLSSGVYILISSENTIKIIL